MFGAIVISLSIILILLFCLERRTILLGAVFVCWALATIAVLLVTLESYEQHLAIIVASIIFAPFVLLFPFSFVSFIILLITSAVRLIKREGQIARAHV